MGFIRTSVAFGAEPAKVPPEGHPRAFLCHPFAEGLRVQGLGLGSPDLTAGESKVIRGFQLSQPPQ